MALLEQAMRSLQAAARVIWQLMFGRGCATCQCRQRTVICVEIAGRGRVAGCEPGTGLSAIPGRW